MAPFGENEELLMGYIQDINEDNDMEERELIGYAFLLIPLAVFFWVIRDSIPELFEKLFVAAVVFILLIMFIAGVFIVFT